MKKVCVWEKPIILLVSIWDTDHPLIMNSMVISPDVQKIHCIVNQPPVKLNSLSLHLEICGQFWRKNWVRLFYMGKRNSIYLNQIIVFCYFKRISWKIKSLFDFVSFIGQWMTLDPSMNAKEFYTREMEFIVRLATTLTINFCWLAAHLIYLK